MQRTVSNNKRLTPADADNVPLVYCPKTLYKRYCTIQTKTHKKLTKEHEQGNAAGKEQLFNTS